MDASITAPQAGSSTRIAALQEMSLGELRGEFEKVLGKASLSRNRKVLVKRIAEKIQADAAGSKTETAKPKVEVPKPTLTVKFERKGKAKAASKAKKTGKEKSAKPPGQRGQRDPRLPKPGTTIEREWHGKKYLVRVLDDGFEYDGKPFRSLSGLARYITGQIINGYLFFALLPKVADPAKGGKGKKS